MTFSETHPSKIFKYCPVCGHNGFNFDRLKSFECLKCHFRYYINEAAATAAIIVGPDGRIILTERAHEPRAGYFDLPGGFVDIGERAEDGLVREIKEELNLTVLRFEFLASFPNEYQFKGISYFTCDLAFVCHIDNPQDLHPADDVAEAIWVDPMCIDFKTISFQSISNILETYQKRLM